MGWWTKLWAPRPAKTDPVNVIGGRVYPLPDDPRWEYASGAFFISRLRVDRADWDYSTSWTLSVDRVNLAEGWEVTLYYKAIQAAYLVRRKGEAETELKAIVAAKP